MLPGGAEGLETSSERPEELGREAPITDEDCFREEEEEEPTVEESSGSLVVALSFITLILLVSISSSSPPLAPLPASFLVVTATF